MFRWIFAIALAIGVPAQAGTIEVQFIGNMAFHISDGKTSLLSDFPYFSGAFGYMKYDMDSVKVHTDSLSLITHAHTDHWDWKLFAETNYSLIGPKSMTKRVKSKKVISFAKTMSYRDMTIEAFETPHKFSPEHYSYLVTWHGKRFYFPGDTETPAHMLQMKDIDVMFISPWLIRTIERQDLVLDTEILIVYHQKIGEEIPPFQDYLRMKQGASIKVEYDDDK